MNLKFILISLQTFSEIFRVLILFWRDIINEYVPSFIGPCYFFQIFTEIVCYRHIFEKYSNTKFQESPSSDSRVVPC